MRTDVLLLVPFQPSTGTFMDAPIRRTSVARINLPAMEARAALEADLGVALSDARYAGPSRTGGSASRHRAASAVVLATHLERAGLTWEAFDPGTADLHRFRAYLEAARARRPRCVALSTTFVVSAPWLRRLCRIVRRTLSDATLLVGGYYYATSAREFLSLDADVLCVGEGEARLPAIVRAIRDGRPEALRAIGGLYLREPDGALRSTGPAEPLDLAALPPPDWSLAERMEPPVRVAKDPLVYVVETQRGCVFKCGYCTYRTLADLVLVGAEAAATRILDAAPAHAAPGSEIDLVDPTATYPSERWLAILNALIAKGGAPHPITTYARVSDVTDDVARRMAQAGVRRVSIGQESGDQDMLNRMHKGTRTDQVRPAVHALARHGIDSVLSFIHGYPGESMASIEATRQLLATINDGAGDAPATVLYRLEPFALFDLASVAQDHASSHYMGYDGTGALSTERMLDEVLRTVIATSRVPGAPVCESLLDWIGVSAGPWRAAMVGADRARVHGVLKALERGVAMYLARQLDGAPIDAAALDSIGATLRAHLPRRSRPAIAWGRARARATAQAARALSRELRREREGAVGPITRGILGALAARDYGDPRAAIARPDEAPIERAPTEEHAGALVSIAHRPKRGIGATIQRAKRDAHDAERRRVTLERG